MPMYDRECQKCGQIKLDCWEPIETPDPKCERWVDPIDGSFPYYGDVGSHCMGTMKRVWLAKPSAVIGDECDVWAQHGLCNEDGSPRHYTSKQEMSREAARRGLTNYVTHLPGKGTDKSKHTVRWV